jgi:hypothetical protein
MTRVTLVPRPHTLGIIIFLLTSFFINSMFQIVATKQRCEFSMKNGRENRTNGNQEKGKEEKEALRKSCTRQKGTRKASPKFFGGNSIVARRT